MKDDLYYLKINQGNQVVNIESEVESFTISGQVILKIIFDRSGIAGSLEDLIALCEMNKNTFKFNVLD